MNESFSINVAVKESSEWESLLIPSLFGMTRRHDLFLLDGWELVLFFLSDDTSLLPFVVALIAEATSEVFSLLSHFSALNACDFRLGLRTLDRRRGLAWYGRAAHRRPQAARSRGCE